MNNQNILEICALSKSYPGFKLDNISLELPKGSIMGLVGRNGAGKTTIIKLILNMINRSAGDITIFGMDNRENDPIIKADIGVVLDESSFPATVNVKEVSSIMKNIYGSWSAGEFMTLCDRLEIPRDKKVKDFSKGMKVKLSIASALAHSPRLLILDEPTSGLDPVVRSEILDMLLEFIQDEERSVLLSSHITTDLEKIADYITFIDSGKIVLRDDKDSLLYKYGILKGKKDDLNTVKGEVLASKITPYGFEALVKDITAAAAKNPGMTADRADIEQVMLFLSGSGRDNAQPN